MKFEIKAGDKVFDFIEWDIDEAKQDVSFKGPLEASKARIIFYEDGRMCWSSLKALDSFP